MADRRNDLYNILGDLWGASDSLAADNVRRLNELTRELESANAIDPNMMNMLTPQETAPAATPVTATESAKEKPAEPPVEKKAETPAEPSFEDFWKLADEQVDWTDALSYAQPQESGIDAEKWTFFHEQAAKVLEGDISAYLAVLKKANPLGDIRPFARACSVHAESADRMTVSFTGVKENACEDTRRFLAGIALRCARDLFALLPVREVSVSAAMPGEMTLDVTFPRSGLQKVRFHFSDPAQLVADFGGTFTEENA